MTDKPLAGRVALVTGGGRGIGRAISVTLAEGGAAIALTYRKDEVAASETVEHVRSIGGNAAAFLARVDSPADSADTVDAIVTQFGKLDIVVSSAGIASRGKPVAETDIDELDRVMRVHSFGPHQLCRAALPHLRRNVRSDIVFVSSVVTDLNIPGGAPYTMAKAAVEALAHTLAQEERANGVHVNIVAPGLVDTEMGRRLVRAQQGIENIRDVDLGSPFGHVCSPEEVAAAVQFLVGPAGSYVNDQRIVVDGGSF